MGLFDMVREKASELLSGAGDKVSELTGTELPGQEAAGNLTETAQGVGETATGAAQDLGETAQGYGDAATGAVQDVTGSATESFTNATDPLRPE